jgi:hypothetical protein
MRKNFWPEGIRVTGWRLGFKQFVHRNWEYDY